MLDTSPRGLAPRPPTETAAERDVLVSGLRGALEAARASSQPTAIFWGAEFRVLFNDACRNVIGDRHRLVAGQLAPIAWSDLWEAAGHRVELALRGEVSFMKAVQLDTWRAGRLETSHYDVTFSPLPGEAGIIGGVLCTFAIAPST